MSIDGIKTICVVGSGAMGQQIAMLCALGGFATVIQDVRAETLLQAEQSLHRLMDGWVVKGKLTLEQKQAAFMRLHFTADLLKAAGEADFVIEAVVEKLDVKRALFAELDRIAPRHAILATNSSTIVSSMLATVTERPDRICNLHFFYPPLVMDCVEVVMSEQTSEETASTAMQLCARINRTSFLLRKEIYGFVANRLLLALMREAFTMYEQGIAGIEEIDGICKKALNHPMGPFELMDFSGNDIVYDAMQQEYLETGDLSLLPPESLKEKVNGGNYGRKTGKGWYNYV